MRKSTNMHCGNRNLRWQLLATASAIALLSSANGAGAANSTDSDRPPLWIELGGQLEALNNAQEPYSPPFTPLLAQEGLFSPLDVQGSPHFSLGADGSISFQPDNTNWIFSASIRYGRSARNKGQHQQTPNKIIHGHVPTLASFGIPTTSFTKYPTSHIKFAEANARQSEQHVILDFQAGKDVGLGMFGSHGSSVLSAGVRIAQFRSKSALTMHLEPDVQYPTHFSSSVAGFVAFRYTPIRFHDYSVMENNKQSFHGVGPSLAWKASVPFAGNANDGEMTFDWGINAAVLFGRQKTSGQHRTNIRSFYKKGFVAGFADVPHGGIFSTVSIATPAPNFEPHDRTRSVTVPNLGGFAGLSMRYSDVKLSFGYRADYFFGAMDTGIDMAKKENRAFYGPYASISVGLGD